MRKNNIIWLAIGLMVLSAITLGSVTLASDNNEPQYGGTLTMFMHRANQSPGSWDSDAGMWDQPTWVSPFIETLLQMDPIRYGPRGTNDYNFQAIEFINPIYFEGVLAEKWEWEDDLTLAFYLREGIMFNAGSDLAFKRVGMEPREVTAFDVEYCLMRYKEGRMGGLLSYIDSFKARDRYTLVVNFNRYDTGWIYRIPVQFGQIYPKEVVETGIKDWRNLIGTGPFILSNYEEDSYVVYKRNPNWWNTKRFFNNQEYDTPFIEELVWPIMVDESAQIAALRSGKIDIHTDVPYIYKDDLEKTASGLNLMEYLEGTALTLRYNFTEPPFNDIKVRQALLIALDQEAIVSSVYTKGQINVYPFSPSLPKEIWTPVEDLPKEVRILFEYNPDLAKKMLAEAGYPNGFKVNLYIAPGSKWQDTGAMIEYYWSQIGIDVSLITREESAIVEMDREINYKGALLVEGGTNKPEARLNFAISEKYMGFYFEEEFVELVKQGLQEKDPNKKNELMKKAGIEWIRLAYNHGLGSKYNIVAWWPWVKNYYGELEAGFINYTPMLTELWIDQELKKSMGY